MKFAFNRCLWVLGFSTVFFAASLSAGTPALAGNITWTGGASTDYATAGNWTGGAVPGGSDTAIFTSTFVNGPPTAIGVASESVGAWQFNSGAPAYTFNVANFQSLFFQGGGIIDQSGHAPTIVLGNASNLAFSNGASAGDAIIEGAPSTANQFISFNNTSTAGNSTINVANGVVVFNDNSTVGNATINATGTGVDFNGNADGGNATISADVNSTIDFTQSTGPGGLNKISIGSISGAGDFYLGDNAVSVGGNNKSTTVSGIISNNCGSDCGGGGNGSIIKVGTGTLTLTGANTYSDGTAIDGGTLNIISDHNLGKHGTALTLDGGTLQYGAAFTLGTTRAVTLDAGGGTIDTNGFDGKIGSTISGGGSLIKAGDGTLTLTGTNAYLGGTGIDGGVLNINSDDNLGEPGTALTFDGGTLQYGAAFTLSDQRNIKLDAGGGTIDTNGFDATIGSNIGGAGGLTKAGDGTLLLTGAVTYSGATTITQGTLQFGDGGEVGPPPGNSRVGTNLVLKSNIFDNAALIFDPASSTSISGNVLGSGTLTITGSGHSLVLTGTDTSTGKTIIDTGATLDIGNGGKAGSLSGPVTDNGSLVFDRSGASTLGGDITGSGSISVIKGALTLSGKNTYSGGTDVTGNSVLGVASDSALGATASALTLGDATTGGTLQFGANVDLPQAITLSAGGGTFDTQDFDGTIDSVIGGSGKLTKVGTGTLILAGTNTYSGGTTISNGTLQLGDGGKTGSLVGNITDNGTFAFDRSDILTYAGVISGSGKLKKAGAGTLILSSMNTYSGGTTITGGTLQLGDGGKAGSIVGNIIDNGALSFDHSNPVTYSDVISGSGKLIKAGAGTLVFSSTNTYSGGTTISEGTLQLGNGGNTGSIIGKITDDGTLAFDRSDAVTYAGGISGSGKLKKMGKDDLTLTGASTLSGDTTVAGGTLSVDGSIASSAVIVDSGTTLDGTGTAGATLIDAGGTLSPGNGIGAFHVDGRLAFAHGAIYDVQLSPTLSDETLATGNAQINGKLVANFDVGPYVAGTKYTLIDSTGSLSGAFASVDTVDLPSGLKASVTYDAHDVFLTLVGPIGPPPINPDAGEIYASMRTAFIEDERLVRNGVLDHVLTPSDSVTAWGEAFTAYGTNDGDGDTATMRHNHAGGIAGVDMPLGNGFSAGLAAAYTSYRISVRERDSDATGDSGHAVAYADWTQDALMLRAGAELGWGDNTISRQVPLVSETDYSRAAGHTAQAFADAGYRIDFGGGFMEPHAELVWIKADDGSFHETGGPLSALSGPSATDSVTYGTLGVRAALAEISLGTAVITPRADFGWQHAFNMSNPSQVVTFNATGDTDTILGVSPSVDTATAQIGFDVALSPNAKLSLGYDGILSEHEKDNAGTVQFQWRF